MKAWIDLFSTDYGLMSVAVIFFVLVMAVYFLRNRCKRVTVY